jgi:hypothetical protein
MEATALDAVGLDQDQVRPQRGVGPGVQPELSSLLVGLVLVVDEP